MMKYRLFHKKIGVKKIEVVCEFESEEIIKDVCFYKNMGFFFLGSETLFFYDNRLKGIAKFNNPNSMCCDKFGVIYLACEDGIKTIDAADSFFVSNLLTKSDHQIMFGKLAKIGFNGVSISEKDKNIAITIAPLNKCYVYYNSLVKREIGEKQGYCVASNINQSYLNGPNGVLLYDQSIVLISDTGNGCIRSFGEQNHKIIIGKPGNKSLEPSKMEIDREKDILYYLSKNYLRSINLYSGHESESYNGENIISMVLGKDSKILVLEEI